MNIEIASPVGGASYEGASYVSLWSVEGQMGVLQGHADLIAALHPGTVRIDTPAGQINGVCGSGFVRIENGDLHIAAEQWTDDPASIDSAARLTEIDAALAEGTGDATTQKLTREKAFLKACSFRLR